MKPDMKKLLLTLAILSFLTSGYGQEKKNTFHSEMIRNSIFENVIEITDNDVVSYGIDYLFTVPIPKSTETPIIFVQTEVPLELLSGIYPEFQKLIVIVPNWTFYKENSNEKLPEGIKCAEPVASFIICEFNRENGKLQKDSLVIMGGSGFPEMNFAEKYKLKDNEAEIYYSEYYGSICCPADPQYSNTPTREDFITFFEKENNTKITDTYIAIIGHEGESAYHYTLKGLSDTQKLKFILERDFHRIINRHLKDIVKTPKIYTPTIIEINSGMEKL